MKKLLKIIATALAIVSFSAGVASAQTITNGNGTGSTNTVTQSSSTNISISNSNDVSCDIDNDQDASSGNATANGNTTVGNVTTGGASNQSSLGCAISASNGPRPSTNKPTTGGGQGAGGRVAGVSSGTGVVAGTSTRVAVASLPETGENSVVQGLALLAAVIGVTAIAAQAGTLAYSKHALKNV